MVSLAIPDSLLWIVIVGFIVAFVLAFGIGANDVANSFGTSVGAKVLTLRQACLLATVFETAGAILLGSKVSETIRKGMLEVDMYRRLDANGTQAGSQLLMAGQLCSLCGSCVWLLVATALRLPVSGTHSIVGATLGFALVANGTAGVNWHKLLLIVSSWFISPLLSGGISVCLFFLIRLFALAKEDPLEPGLRLLPLIYSLTIGINIFSIVYEGPAMFGLDKIPLWGALSISFALATLCSVLVKLLLIPWQRSRILRELKAKTTDELPMHKEVAEAQQMACGHDSGPGDTLLPAADKEQTRPDNKEQTKPAVVDRPEQGRIFSWLQVLTAIFGSFAHGGNDVSNAIGPLVGLWIIATTGSVASKAATPVYILLYGGLGISIGLWVWGRRVIKTLGEDLTTITPSSGFCIELGAALAVLFASNIGVPISTTHCKVGSVVLVGRFRSKANVQWSVFRNIVAAWVVTLPASGLISAGVMAVLRAVMF